MTQSILHIRTTTTTRLLTMSDINTFTMGSTEYLATVIKPFQNPHLIFCCKQFLFRKMNRAKVIMASLRLVRSRIPTHLSQGSQYHHFSPLLSSSFSLPNCTSNISSYFNTQQKLYFSSEPNTIFDLIATNEWSQGLEKGLLEKFDSTPLTHETVVYILKKLENAPRKAFDFFNWVCDKHGFKPNSIVYNVMLVVLSKEETLKEFWGLTEKMSEEGCHVDERAYVTVIYVFKKCKMLDEAASWEKYYAKMNEESGKDCNVKGVVEALLGSDWNDGVKDRLEEFKGSLTENTVIKIFHALRGDTVKAVCFFHWLRDSAGHSLTAVTYNAILRIIWKKNSVQEFWKIVNEMKSGGYDIDFDTYLAVSRNFDRMKMFEDFIKMCDLMMDGPYKALDHDCSLILRDISRTSNPDMDLVSRVVKKHEEVGYPISKAVYDGIYRCLTSAGKFDDAEKVLDKMRNAGVQPDDLTYYHGLFALGKAGKLEEGIEMLEKFEFKYVQKSWTNFIRGLCTAGDIDKALKCYTVFMEKKLEVDADLLDILVKILCKHRRVDSAYNLVIELVSKTDLKPFHATYRNLIQDLLGDEKLKEGFSLLHLMKKHDFELVRDPFVDYISKFGTVENAKEFLEALKVKKCPSVSVHSHVLQSFLKEGRESEAQDLLEKYPQHIRNHADISKVFASLKPEKATV